MLPPKKNMQIRTLIPASSKGFCLDPRDGVWSSLIFHDPHPLEDPGMYLFLSLKGEPVIMRVYSPRTHLMKSWLFVVAGIICIYIYIYIDL